MPGRPVSYRLDPDNNWFPDLEDLENRSSTTRRSAGILIINPDNPTGAVYPEEILRGMVALAKEYDLFIIADEVYQNIVYNGTSTKPMAEVIGDVPCYRHARHLQGDALAGFALRLDRGLQRPQ